MTSPRIECEFANEFLMFVVRQRGHDIDSFPDFVILIAVAGLPVRPGFVLPRMGRAP